MNCYTHPAVQTNLRCGKCGKPICPKCLVQTPVGAKCLLCARLYRLPTYRVPVAYYLRGVGAGVGLAGVFGFLWGLVQAWMPYFYLSYVLAPLAGYGMAELLSLAVNRKRGTGLVIVMAATVVASYLVSLVPRGGFPLMPFSLQFLISDVLALALGVFVAVRYFLVK